MSNSNTVTGSHSFMTISKAEFGRNIFGSPFLHTLIKAAYTWGTFVITAFVILLSPTFIFALVALIISRFRYSATKIEKDVEKHGAFITKVSQKVFAGAGIRLQPEQVVRLWMNRMIIAEGWIITVKEPAGEDNFEIIGAELKKE